MKILFCNIGWMLYYHGFIHSDSTISGGGSHPAEWKHERYNFLPIGGKCYGYVRAGEKDRLNLKRLSGSKDFSEDRLENVLVVWTATHPQEGGRRIVGWYKNATVFVNQQESARKEREYIGYLVSAKAEDCTCIDERERTFIVPNGKEVEGFFGQANICYADTRQAMAYCRKIIRYIDSYVPSTHFDKRNATPYTDQDNTEEIVMEGGKKTVMLNQYERSAKNRKKCIEKYGCKCAVCGFDFQKAYGKIGEGFIHIHHLNPISELGGRKKVEVDDLRPVCPNCHAMLHRKKDGVYSISELKNMMKR